MPEWLSLPHSDTVTERIDCAYALPCTVAIKSAGSTPFPPKLSFVKPATLHLLSLTSSLPLIRCMEVQTYGAVESPAATAWCGQVIHSKIIGMVDIKGINNEIMERLPAVCEKGIKRFMVSGTMFQGEKAYIYIYIVKCPIFISK